MTKLNQIIAVVGGLKTKTSKALTEVYHKLQKSPLFDGLSRTYRPLDEDGETQPPENKLVQYTVDEAVKEVSNMLTRTWDAVYTQDVGNTLAKANIEIDGRVIAENVPVTYLLFLEKQLNDLHTFVNTLPTLDPAYEWKFDENRNFYVTDPLVTNRTKKVLRNHVKAEATDKHPAQVEVYTEDVKVGEWSTVKFSGAMPAKRKKELLDRVYKLQQAVKMAREEANTTEIEQKQVANNLLSFVFGD